MIWAYGIVFVAVAFILAENILRGIHGWRIGLRGSPFVRFVFLLPPNAAHVLRYITQANEIGLDVNVLYQVAAEASGVDVRTVKSLYSGSGAVERYTYRPYVGLQLAPNQHLNYGETNEFGFQGRPRTGKKEANVKHVMLLGGSVAFGMGCTAKERSVGYQLEALLNATEQAKGRGVRWEVINLAALGMTSTGELNQLMIYSPLFSPDYVVELSGFNDIHMYLCHQKLYTHLWYSKIGEFVSGSTLQRVIGSLADRFYIFKIFRWNKARAYSGAWEPEGEIYTVW